MNENDILPIVKNEFKRNGAIGYIQLPETNAILKNAGKTFTAYGERTWSNRYKKSFNYLYIDYHKPFTDKTKIKFTY